MYSSKEKKVEDVGGNVLANHHASSFFTLVAEPVQVKSIRDPGAGRQNVPSIGQNKQA